MTAKKELLHQSVTSRSLIAQSRTRLKKNVLDQVKLVLT